MLYRTYRPQKFSDVVGQSHVVLTLQGGLKNNRIGHAYLFAGPRGTGKTTIARIFAKAVNCEKRDKTGDPDGSCANCTAIAQGNSLDLVEIDAASNRGIDEIRAIKESAQVSAPGGGYKVFLIDEVHMLTKDAFNALLKILEEPPAHVIFILATTEAHKILPTVLSRVQRFDFKKLTHKEILSKLQDICEQEKVKVDDDALMALAASSDGALRDAEVALTKVLASVDKKEKITLETVSSILGLIPLKAYPEFLSYLVKQDRSASLAFIQKLHSSGFDLDNFSKEFLEYLRKVMMQKINPAILASTGTDLVGEHATMLNQLAQAIDSRQLVKILQTITTARADMKISPIPQLPLELAVMELCQ